MDGMVNKLLEKKMKGEIDHLMSIQASDLTKMGIVMQEFGKYIAMNKNFRAVLEYSPEADRYYVSIKFR